MNLIRSICAALVAALLSYASFSPAPAEAGRLRISHQWAADKDARDHSARVLAAEAQKRAPGLTISIHPDSSLGIAPLDQYDAMLDGRIEAAIFPLFYISPRIPELSVTLLPGVPPTIEHANMLKGTEFHRRLQALAVKNGFHIVTWWWLAGGLVSIDEGIGGIDDMKGVHIRSGDKLFDLMFARAGAVPMTMPSTEIVEEMRAGRLNIAQASLETLLSMNTQKVARSAVIGGNALYISLHPLMVSSKAWSALSDPERKAIEAAAGIADLDFLASQTKIESQTVAAFESAGVKTREMKFDEYEKWLRLAQQTSWMAYRGQSPESAALIDALLTSLIQSKPAK